MPEGGGEICKHENALRGWRDSVGGHLFLNGKISIMSSRRLMYDTISSLQVTGICSLVSFSSCLTDSAIVTKTCCCNDSNSIIFMIADRRPNCGISADIMSVSLL